MDLAEYRSVASGRRLPAYMRAEMQKLGQVDLEALSESQLWGLHDQALSQEKLSDCGISLLDLKIELADRMLSHCMLCERRCGVNRIAGEKGFCGVGKTSHYFLEKILWGEERPLVPSHEVFFSGCNLRCSYCYSYESLEDTEKGEQAVPGKLSEIIDSRKKDGALNVNLIGGEPTVHLPVILKTLKLLDTHTAVVWNSNFYMSKETMQLLDGVVDLYVGDFRFGNDQCAKDIGSVRRYYETASRNLRQAAKSGDLIIRHLLIPGHVECCLRPVANWVIENLPETPFNLMFQYTPFYKALDDPALCRILDPGEEKMAREIVSSLGLNTDRWNQSLVKGAIRKSAVNDGIETIITVRPDGTVGVMHLHSELLELVQALELGGS